MTKRKTPEDQAASSRKPTKKRVPFTAPKHAATKALILRNASYSPLLKLPAEIRNEIWRHVLGDRLIHIDYFDNSELNEILERTDVTNYKSAYGPGRCLQYGGGHVGSGWNYCVCVNDGPEKTLDVKDVIGNEDRVDADEKELNEEAVLSCEPHELCTFEYDESHHTRPTRLWDHQTLHLSLLRACRQTYAEANRVLWISNTFSFGDAIGFKQFMMTRNSHRKRLIRSLRFEMDYAFNRPDKWNNALQMSVVRSLSGLRSLRLQLVYNMDVSIWPMFGTSYFLEGAGCSEGLQRLSTLPLTAVEAVIRAPQRRLQTMMWKKDHREETAEALRQMLLNPKGVEVYQAAQQARKDMINGR